MTTKLSGDLRQAMEEHGGVLVYVVDAITGARYVLMRAEQFEKIRGERGHPRFLGA